MTDELALESDPELARWRATRRKLEANAEALKVQGGLVARATSSGRTVWTVRFVDRTGARPVHHSVYIGADERLVALAREQVACYRLLGHLPAEIAGHARLAASASYAVRRLAAGCRRARG